MNKYLRFLITDVNTSFNKGDLAIIIGFLKTLRENYPDSEIDVLTLTPQEDAKYYAKYKVNVHGRLFTHDQKHISKYNLLVVYTLKMILFLCWSKIHFIPIPKHEKKILMLYNDADLIISCGGGTLGSNALVSITKSLFPMYLAKKLGKKVFISAQSIELFKSQLIKNLTKFVLNKVDLITVREKYSLELLKNIGIKKPFFLTADTAFLVGHESVETGKLLLKTANVPCDSKLRIGMTVMKWRFPGENGDVKFLEYVNTIVQAIEEILEKTDSIIVFFPNVIFSPKEDDREIAVKIKEMVKETMTTRLHVLTGNYSPEELKAMIGTMDIFIGTRIHSNIFATTMFVPTITIAYEKKHYGIMEMTGLEEYVLDISNFTSSQIIHLTDRLIQNRETLRNRLKEKIPIIQNEAIKNIQMVTSLLKR